MICSSEVSTVFKSTFAAFFWVTCADSLLVEILSKFVRSTCDVVLDARARVLFELATGTGHAEPALRAIRLAARGVTTSDVTSMKCERP